MKIKIPFFGAMVLSTSFVVTGIAVASENFLSKQVQADIQPSGEKTALRSLALALSSGKEAMRPFCGPPSENHAESDRFNVPIAGMDCYIGRIAGYISCYSSPIDPEEADTLFTRLMDELRAALPSETWKGIKKEPGLSSVRSCTYENRNSSAHIDIDIIARMEPGGQSSHMVLIFAWPHWP
jgi:hypothetical protein